MSENLEHNSNETGEIQEPVTTYKEKYLKLLADMENMRKRQAVQIQDALQNGFNQGFGYVFNMYEILTMAVKTEGESDLTNILFSEIHKLFNENEIRVIEPVEGEVFDDEYHNALFTPDTDVHELKGKISETLRVGFQQGDQIIRHADVAVYR